VEALLSDASPQFAVLDHLSREVIKPIALTVFGKSHNRAHYSFPIT
jgi:hypothetical protein